MMKYRLFSLPLSFLIFLVVITTGYLWGVASVPFHPDESTYLFTSGDAEIFWKRPADVFWKPEDEGDLRQIHRELDAPLIRNLIALGRWIAGQPAPQQDWNWGQTWQENQRSGSLPGSDLLITGRLAVAALFPFSLLFLFLSARAFSNELTAWIAVLLLASNSLVLLHTRRAMAEGALLFTTILTIWAILQVDRRTWLIAIPAALAFCAKQSLAALALAGLLAVFLQSRDMSGRSLASRLGYAGLYIATFALIVLLLHPFVWRQPIPALRAAIVARQKLANEQIADRPGQVLDNPAKKIIGMVGSLYLTPPMFAETSNYVAETRASEAAYGANPFHSLFRSMTAGAILLGLSLFGFLMGMRAVFKGTGGKKMAMLLITTVLETAALLWLIPLPWQRYYMPLVPFAVLWTAYGLNLIGMSVCRSIPTKMNWIK